MPFKPLENKWLTPNTCYLLCTFQCTQLGNCCAVTKPAEHQSDHQATDLDEATPVHKFTQLGESSVARGHFSTFFKASTASARNS